MIKSARTEFKSELKEQWIEGLNNGGNHELLLFVKEISPFKKIKKVELIDIFHEGFLVLLVDDSTSELIEYFYEYTEQADEPMQTFMRLYSKTIHQNTPDLKNNRLFRLSNKLMVAPSFMRLRLAYNDTLPQNILPAFIAVFSIGDNLSRAYTYRRVNTEQQWVDVDFFLHGKTPTFEWLEQLEIGAEVVSLREKNESVNHLHEGKVLLCGDETAFPAIAALLDSWQNPQPPFVLLEMLNPADYSYFDDCQLPEGTEIHALQVDSPENYGKQVKAFLEERQDVIDNVWGAFHVEGMKLLKRFFESKYSITSANMVVRAYWNAHKKSS